MLINFTNHPYNQWNDVQKEAASLYGEVVDLPFPEIDPMGDEVYIKSLVDSYFLKIQSRINDEKTVIHIMGEMTFTYMMLDRLKQDGIECIASTSKRIVNVNVDGSKNVTFVFARFRRYM